MGMFYVVTNEIAHYYVVKNSIMISPADDSRLHRRMVPLNWAYTKVAHMIVCFMSATYLALVAYDVLEHLQYY